MKKTVWLILLLLLISMIFPGYAEEGENLEAAAEQEEAVEENTNSEVFQNIPETPLWNGLMAFNSRVYDRPSDDAKELGRVLRGERIKLYAFDPSWAYISYGSLRGYIRRSVIDHANPIDKSTTPAYGVDVYMYSAILQKDTPVMSRPESGETLITLHEGAKVALIGFENGWGKLIFKRQYGYIHPSCIGELIMTYPDATASRTDKPIAAFVSFYKITDDESNLGRMRNIEVACEKLSALLFRPGEGIDFNKQIGPYTAANGYEKATVLVAGGSRQNYGGGTCQVSSTLYNAVLQLTGITVTERHPHGAAGASYLPHGVDAAVGSKTLNFKFRNDYDFPVRIDAHAQDGALYIAIYRAETN